MELSSIEDSSEVAGGLPALQAFCHLMQGHSVLLKMENTMAVAYVKKQGGTESRMLLSLVAPILNWAQDNLLHLSAV